MPRVFHYKLKNCAGQKDYKDCASSKNRIYHKNYYANYLAHINCMGYVDYVSYKNHAYLKG